MVRKVWAVCLVRKPPCCKDVPAALWEGRCMCSSASPRPQEGIAKGGNQGIKGNAEQSVSMGEVPPRFAKFMESGYLQAAGMLRDKIMDHEWKEHGMKRAEGLAIAEFEEFCATEGFISMTGQHALDPTIPSISYNTISELYADPRNLEIIKDDALRARLRAMIHKRCDEREREAYRDATQRAGDMSKLLKEGPGSLAEFIQGIIPIPGFLKVFK